MTIAISIPHAVKGVERSKRPTTQESMLAVAMKSLLIAAFILFSAIAVVAQSGALKGNIHFEGKPIGAATISILGTNRGTVSDSSGQFIIAPLSKGSYKVRISSVGFSNVTREITISPEETVELSIELISMAGDLGEVVVTGTMKEVSRTASPVPVEVFTPKFFQKNPTPNLFEAVGMINGVQPQLNCNVCNTGDIHINGMEGPYTMILIDGMPIVSALSTVYGLSGIPNSLVERIEVVKGPASSLYGSEAMGGIINVITKDPLKAAILSTDVFLTDWQEYTADVSVKFKVGKATSLIGVNFFNFQERKDKNKDGFTDIPLQNRVSVFNKWNFNRASQKLASIGARYVYENRWGGEMQWNKSLRGSNTVYGESIYTRRWELIGMYQLPTTERIITQFSFNGHNQDSYYGTIPYKAEQKVAFAQAYWDKPLNEAHNLLIGTSFRYTYYDDNTPGTAAADGITNHPDQVPLPGLFIQDEFTINDAHTILAGYRFDYDRRHKAVHSPRLAYKWMLNAHNTLRASIGTGFRVVNLFTEDHAALTGARQVVIAHALNPERSYNGNLNYIYKLSTAIGTLNIDATGFYSMFTNKIIGDFDTDPQKIIYANLEGHAITRGVSVNADFICNFPLKLTLGGSFMDVYQMEENGHQHLEKSVQIHAPKWSGNFLVGYTFKKKLVIDLTGTWTGPMRLPTVPDDFRPAYSPWFTIANIQFTKKFDKGFELYGGVKNIFNFIPKHPLLHADDPFNQPGGKYFLADGQANMQTNPYGYTFDPSYNYSSLQGVRCFLGFRYNLFM